MDKKSLEEYLKKLEGFEKTLSHDEENVDDAYINEIAKVLSDLSMDSLSHDEEIGKEFKNSGFTVPNKDTITFNPEDEFMHATLRCKIKLTHPDAVVPQYSKTGDAGLDLQATTMVIDKEKNQITYGTGVSLEIPLGFVGLVYPRSSIRKTKLSLTNSVGVIDSGYRGEIMATFNYSNSESDETYSVGDRICQLMIVPYPKIDFILSDNLSETERGDGGFGSTGK
tara:strand:- start:2562 stop:3236 length:675 start_codon:yes stop_codon:yes gene_type:complete